jgi:hypothetical protein
MVRVGHDDNLFDSNTIITDSFIFCSKIFFSAFIFFEPNKKAPFFSSISLKKGAF